MFIEEELKIDL